jgi:peptidoglycan/LPS O-acetylase OafA/YrhL
VRVDTAASLPRLDPAAVIPGPRHAHRRTQAALPARDGERFRGEVEGLRGLACALIVVHHVWTGRVSGGVDVFLVLTGFFLTGSLLRQLRRTGTVDAAGAVARTATRVLPTAMLVALATAVTALVLLPVTRWREVLDHALASALSLENQRLLRDAADYNAGHVGASPFQHFWSLSIQVQFLVAFPLVVLAVAWLAARTGRRPERAVVAVVAMVTAGSLWWSVALTARDQPVAYFATSTRLWELGVGALVAACCSRLVLSARVSLALGWAGCAALLACAFALNGARSFPGAAALWPVACAVAVLLAGDRGGPRGVHHVLGSAPLRRLGEISFALYLWHWPVLVLAQARTGAEAPSLRLGLAVIAASLVLAIGTTAVTDRRLAERLRRLPGQRGALVAVAAGVLPLVVISASGTAWMQRQAGPAGHHDAATPPGALALTGAVTAAASMDPVPALETLREDWPGYRGDGCAQDDDLGLMEICAGSPDGAERTIVVVGDSHAAQWLTPLAALTEHEPWRLVAIVAGGCSLSTDSEVFAPDDPRYEDCRAWRERVVDRILEQEPDLVVTLGTRTHRAIDGGEVVPPGYLAKWQELSDHGVPVMAMRDSPRFPFDVPDCIATAGEDLAQCTLPREAVYDDAALSSIDLPGGVTLVDTSGWFCDAECAPLVGGAWAYLDDNHATLTYMRTTAALVRAEVQRVTGW